MNASELTFGIEIETTIPRGVCRVGPHGDGYDIPQLPGWKADCDSSIRVSDHEREACEFVSPVFRGSEGLSQLLSDLAFIKSLGATVNASCGLHIHVGFDKSDAGNSVKLATLVSNFEKAIYASTGTKNRERGRWCEGLNRYGNAEAALRGSRAMRYHVANFATTKPTVEIRAFSATLNPVKLVGYVQLCLGLVEKAIESKRVTNWTAKEPVESSPIHRGGVGQTALNRLFYQLGWTKGRQSREFGVLAAIGVPTLKRIKKELMRLARKYDGEQ